MPFDRFFDELAFESELLGSSSLSAPLKPAFEDGSPGPVLQTGSGNETVTSTVTPNRREALFDLGNVAGFSLANAYVV